MPLKLYEIRECPTVLEVNSNQKYHESIFRSYQLLEKVKELLARKVPSDVILEIIRDTEHAEQQELKLKDLENANS